jgi:hypothetical protein
MKRQPWRCVHCGQWRYYQNRPCHTCERLAVRWWIDARRAQ